MAALHQKAGISIKELKTMFPPYSTQTIYRHANRDYHAGTEDKRKNNPGRPSKLLHHDTRAILRAVREGPNFTASRIKVEARLTGVVSNRTVQRVLAKNGYRYRQARRRAH